MSIDLGRRARLNYVRLVEIHSWRGVESRISAKAVRVLSSNLLSSSFLCSPTPATGKEPRCRSIHRSRPIALHQVLEMAHPHQKQFSTLTLPTQLPPRRQRNQITILQQVLQRRTLNTVNCKCRWSNTQENTKCHR